MVSGRLAAGKTSLGTSARAWTGWLEAGRELSRELPNTSGDACAINAPARSALECRGALSARPLVATAHTGGYPWSATCQSSAAAWPSQAQQQYRTLHLAASDSGSSSGRAGDDVPPTTHDVGDAHQNPTLAELCTLAQDWRRHALEANQDLSSSSSSINNTNGARRSGLADLDAAPDAPPSLLAGAGEAHGIPLALVERTCTLLDKRLRNGVFSAPAKSRRGSHHTSIPAGTGINGGGAAAAADLTVAVQRRVALEALAAVIASVARCFPCDGRSPPPDLARSLVAAATAVAHTAPWPQAAAILQGMVRLGTVGKTFLDRILTRVQRIPLGPEPAAAHHTGARFSRGAAAARKGAQQGMAAAAAAAPAAAGPSAHVPVDDAAAAPSAEDAISLLRTLSVLHSLQPVATAAPNLGGAMQRLMAHVQARLHTLPGPQPLLGLLRDVTSCGWRHDREPEFLCRVADCLCARAPPAEPAAGAAAGAAAHAQRPFGDCDDEGELARPPRLLALTPSQVVEVLCVYARSGVPHAVLMERGLDAVDACLPALTPSQAARVAEACARFSHQRPRPAVMRRLALHVAAHLELPQARVAGLPAQVRQLQEVGTRPEAQEVQRAVGPPAQTQVQEGRPPHPGLEQQQQQPQLPQQPREEEVVLQLPPAGGLPVAPGDVAASVAALARCGVRDDRFLDAAAAYAGAHAAAQLAEAEEQARAQWDQAGAQARRPGPPAQAQQAAAAAAGGVAFGEPAAALQGAAAAAAALQEATREVSGGEAPPREAVFGSSPCGSSGSGGTGCTGASEVSGSSQRAVAAGRPPGAPGAEGCNATHGAQLRSQGADCSARRQEPLGAPGSCSARGTSAARPGAGSGAESGSGEQDGVPIPAPGPEPEPGPDAWAHRTGLAAPGPHLWSEAAVLGQPVPVLTTSLKGQPLPDRQGSRNDSAVADEEVALLEALLSPPPAPDSAAAGHGHGFQLPGEGLRLPLPPPPPPVPPQQPHTSPAPGLPGPCGRGASSLIDAADAGGGGEANPARLAAAGADAAASSARCATAPQCPSPGEEGGGGAEAAAAGARDAAACRPPALSSLRGVSLEGLVPDRTALVLRGLSPALPPRELLGELLAVPGATIDLYYMPYDFAAVSRGRPGLGCAFLGVTSTDSVAALARRLQEGSICPGAERAVLEYVSPANSDALLRALLSPASGYAPPRSDTSSRPLLLYVSGALRGKMQPIEPKGVETHELRWPGGHRHAAGPGTFILPQLQQLQPLQQQQHRQQQQQQRHGHEQQLPCWGQVDTGTAPPHGQTILRDLGPQPRSEERAAARLPPVGCGNGGGETHGSSPPHRSDAPPAQPHPKPEPSQRQRRQLLDVQQLALIAHSMAVLSYHPPSMLGALGRLMRCLLQPALRDPRLVLALLPPPAVDADTETEAEAALGAGRGGAARAAPAAATASAGGDGGGGCGSPPLPPSWPPMPPLKSVLHALHALASQPHPDPAACGELADVCAAALSAWVPGASRCEDGPAAAAGAAPPTTGPHGPAAADVFPYGRPGTDYTAAAAAAVALPPSDVLDIHVRLLAQVLTACADHGARLYHPRLCDAAAALLRHRLRALRMRAACALLQPLVRLRHPPAGRLVAAVAPLLAQDCSRLSAASLVDLAWACARTGGLRCGDGGDSGDDSGDAGTQVVHALALRTRQLLHQLPTVGVVQMFWALAALGYDGGGGGAAAATGGPDLHWQLLQVLLHRYDLGARDLLLLQEGMELRRRWWRQRRRRHGPPGMGVADPAAAAAADSGDLMEFFLQELIYRAGAVAGAGPGSAAEAAGGVTDGPRCQSTAAAGSAAAVASAVATSPGPPGAAAFAAAAAAGAASSRPLAPGPSAGAAPPQPAAGEEGCWDAAAGAKLRHGHGAAWASTPPLLSSRRMGSEFGYGECDEPRGADVAGAVAVGLGQLRTSAEEQQPLAAPHARGADPAAVAAATSRLPGACSPPTGTTARAPSPPNATTGCAGACSCGARKACIGLSSVSSSTVPVGVCGGGVSFGVCGEGDSGGCRDGRRAVPAAAATAAAAAAATGEHGTGGALAGGGLLQQILVARRGLALDEADGVMMRLQVPEALLARARAMSAAASS